MGRSKNTSRAPEGEPGFDPDVDRFPGAVDGLRRIIQEGVLPEGPIDRLEVSFLASGEVAYRWREPRAEEWGICHLSAPGLS